MNKISKQGVRAHYKNPGHLEVRKYFQERFSLNKTKQTWHQWVFEQLVLPTQCKILELGCGLGNLWQENAEKIPVGWEITLSDFSSEMLDKTKQNLSSVKHKFKFEIIDAEQIPYPDGQFDVVIANSLLYLLENMEQAVSEMSRVLKKSGMFVASTSAAKKELVELLQISKLPVHTNYGYGQDFSPKRGKYLLKKYFDEVKVVENKGELLVTEAKPMADYILSTNENLNESQKQQVYNYFDNYFAKKREFYMTNVVGLFIAKK